MKMMSELIMGELNLEEARAHGWSRDSVDRVSGTSHFSFTESCTLCAFLTSAPPPPPPSELLSKYSKTLSTVVHPKPTTTLNSPRVVLVWTIGS